MAGRYETSLKNYCNNQGLVQPFISEYERHGMSFCSIKISDLMFCSARGQNRDKIREETAMRACIYFRVIPPVNGRQD